jgi:cytoskeletal protein RodZ
MERFGEELRIERERRKVTLQTVCAMTKVSVRHLEALEEDRLDELPGGVFRKGIVKSYLGAVGLEESPWIEKFERNLREIEASAASENDWVEFAENVRRNRSSETQSTNQRWFGVGFMMMALGGLGWILWHFVLHNRLSL